MITFTSFIDCSLEDDFNLWQENVSVIVTRILAARPKYEFSSVFKLKSSKHGVNILNGIQDSDVKKKKLTRRNGYIAHLVS